MYMGGAWGTVRRPRCCICAWGALLYFWQYIIMNYYIWQYHCIILCCTILCSTVPPAALHPAVQSLAVPQDRAALRLPHQTPECDEADPAAPRDRRSIGSNALCLPHQRPECDNAPLVRRCERRHVAVEHGRDDGLLVPPPQHRGGGTPAPSGSSGRRREPPPAAAFVPHVHSPIPAARRNKTAVDRDVYAAPPSPHGSDGPYLHSARTAAVCVGTQLEV